MSGKIAACAGVRAAAPGGTSAAKISRSKAIRLKARPIHVDRVTSPSLQLPQLLMSHGLRSVQRTSGLRHAANLDCGDEGPEL